VISLFSLLRNSIIVAEGKDTRTALSNKCYAERETHECVSSCLHNFDFNLPFIKCMVTLPMNDFSRLPIFVDLDG
jgi:hypothetical protein